jgi:hypothetical protein
LKCGQVYSGIEKDLIIMARDTKTKRYAENINATLQKVASAYYPEPSATDQGAAVSGSNLSLYDIITGIGVSKYAKIVLRHTGISNTTTYKLDTSLDLSSYPYITIEVQPGAVFDDVTGDEVLTLYSPHNIIANQQIFAEGLEVTFEKGGEVYPEWWGAKGDGTTDDYTALQAAVDAIKETSSNLHVSSISLRLRPDVIYKIGTTLFLGDDVGNDGCRSVVGTRSIIMGSGITGAVIDWTGTNVKEMEGVSIYGDPSSPPDIGILLARRTDDISAAYGKFKLINVRGTFDTCAVYNWASEVNSWIECDFTVTAPRVYVQSQDNSTYSITVPNSSATNSYANSNNDNYFLRCNFGNLAASGTAVSCIELLSVKNVGFYSCFIDDSAEDISRVQISNENQASFNIAFRDGLMHSTYDTGFYLSDGIYNLTIEGMRWGFSWTTANIESAEDMTLYDCKLEAEDIDFSASGSDVVDSSFIKITNGSNGVLSVARHCNGIVQRPHDASVTFSGTMGTQVTCFEQVTGSDPMLIDHGNSYASYDATEYKQYTKTATLIFGTADTQTIWSKTLNDEEAIIVTAWISFKQATTARRGMYAVRALVYRDGGGSATIQGSVQDIHTAVETDAGYDGTITVSSNDVRVSVTNGFAVSTRWIAKIDYQVVTG